MGIDGHRKILPNSKLQIQVESLAIIKAMASKYNFAFLGPFLEIQFGIFGFNEINIGFFVVFAGGYTHLRPGRNEDRTGSPHQNSNNPSGSTGPPQQSQQPPPTSNNEFQIPPHHNMHRSPNIHYLKEGK